MARTRISFTSTGKPNRGISGVRNATKRTWWNSLWLPAALLVAATFLAYQPAWRAGFIWDDDVYVTRNVLLTAPDGLFRIWFSQDSPSQYCPMVYTSFRFERPFWGLNPTGYHLVNILLHATNALLVWRLLRRLAVPGAWLAAAFFALHPVHVESVAWITERKNVLSLLFYLLALLAWVDFVQNSPKARWRDYVQAIVFFLLALFSKTTACTLPAALLLVLWFQRKPVTRLRVLQITPFVSLGLGMGLLTMWWERFHQGTGGSLFSIGCLESLLIASRAVWFYAAKLFWPANLMFSYPRWTINPSDPLAYIWLVVGVVLLLIIVFSRRYVGRSVETAAAFYVATLSPLLGFIMLYTFRYSFVADHYQYVASIGPLALVAAGITLALGAHPKAPANPATHSPPCGRTESTAVSADTSLASLGPKPYATVTVFGVLLLALGILTWRQSHMYASAETLYYATIARNPASFMAHNNLGTALLRKGQVDEALAKFQEVLRLQPDYEVGYYNLGLALLRKGQTDEALAQFQKAIQLKPDYAAAHNNLANLCQRQDQPREAIAHYQLAARFRPKNADIANNLAWLLATCPDPTLRNGHQAIELAEKAERLSAGRDPLYIATLAAAYAEAGRFPQAVFTAQRALSLASLQRNAALAEVVSQQLALYQKGAPFRDTARRTASPASDQP
jgi:protein O-mannosyl-transferase